MTRYETAFAQQNVCTRRQCQDGNYQGVCVERRRSARRQDSRTRNVAYTQREAVICTPPSEPCRPVLQSSTFLQPVQQDPCPPEPCPQVASPPPCPRHSQPEPCPGPSLESCRLSTESIVSCPRHSQQPCEPPPCPRHSQPPPCPEHLRIEESPSPNRAYGASLTQINVPPCPRHPQLDPCPQPSSPPCPRHPPADPCPQPPSPPCPRHAPPVPCPTPPSPDPCPPPSPPDPCRQQPEPEPPSRPYPPCPCPIALEPIPPPCPLVLEPIQPAPCPCPLALEPIQPAPCPCPLALEPIQPAPCPRPLALEPIIPPPCPCPRAPEPIPPAPCPCPVAPAHTTLSPCASGQETLPCHRHSLPETYIPCAVDSAFSQPCVWPDPSDTRSGRADSYILMRDPHESCLQCQLCRIPPGYRLPEGTCAKEIVEPPPESPPPCPPPVIEVIQKCPPCPEPSQATAALETFDQLVIVQELRTSESSGGCNHFRVVNNKCEDLFDVIEESSFFSRNCLGRGRSLTLHVYDMNKKRVISMHRPYICNLLCCRQGLQELSVACECTELGFVYQEWSMSPLFYIEDPNQDCLFKITGGPRPKENAIFQIYSADGHDQVGNIRKSGLVREVYPYTDNFTLNFPRELCVPHKLLLLAAVFLVDLTYYD